MPPGKSVLLSPTGGRIPGSARRHHLCCGNKCPQGLPAQRGSGTAFGNIVATLPEGQQHTDSPGYKITQDADQNVYADVQLLSRQGTKTQKLPGRICLVQRVSRLAVKHGREAFLFCSACGYGKEENKTGIGFVSVDYNVARNLAVLEN